MYYYFGVFDDFLIYVFGVGDLFDVNGYFEYVEIIIGKVNYC